MKIQIQDLDSNIINWIPKAGNNSKTSKYHKLAKNLLTELFPVNIILEEVTLPIKRGTKLRADFFIPSHLLIVEVQGQQHYEYNSFHYKNKRDFIKAKERDEMKREWAELNNIELVELPYNESRENWTRRFTETE